MAPSEVTPKSLRAVLAQVIQALELAQSARICVEQEASRRRNEAAAAVQAQAATQLAAAQAEYGHPAPQAENERFGQLCAVIDEVEQAAGKLLQAGGLAHLAGAPLALGEDAGSLRRDDASVIGAFDTAQRALIELRGSVLRLAHTQVAAGEMDMARRTLTPLLADTDAPLYTDAHNLLCSTYYQAGQEYLQAGHWDMAQAELEKVYALDADYLDARFLLAGVLQMGAQAALDQGNQVQASRLVERGLDVNPDDRKTKTLIDELPDTLAPWKLCWQRHSLKGDRTSTQPVPVLSNSGLLVCVHYWRSDEVIGSHYRIGVWDRSNGRTVFDVGAGQLAVSDVWFNADDTILCVKWVNGDRVNGELMYLELDKGKATIGRAGTVVERPTAGRTLRRDILISLHRRLPNGTTLASGSLSPDHRWLVTVDHNGTIYLFSRQSETEGEQAAKAP